MKKILAAAAVLVTALPAAAQGNPTPYSQEALNACPALMQRTQQAIANGHESYYYASDCECIARSIDSPTWNEATMSYDGPRMPDSDAQLIVRALKGTLTIEDAISWIDSGVSEAGYSAVSACYGK